MLRHVIALLLTTVALAACDNNFTPREKTARYDPATRSLELPYPCPDWSQSQVHNYENQLHSNYGCAVNNNLAVQLENPEDLQHGYGNASPDTETTTRVIERYRSGELPVELAPLQSTGTSQ